MPWISGAKYAMSWSQMRLGANTPSKTTRSSKSLKSELVLVRRANFGMRTTLFGVRSAAFLSKSPFAEKLAKAVSSVSSKPDLSLNWSWRI